MTMRQILLYAVSLFIISILPACMDLKQPSLDMQYYTLEYEAPAFTERETLPYIIKVENFNAAPLYNTTAIIYKERAYNRGSYPYHRWMTAPADIITYLLGRDLKNSGMFKGVIMPGERNREVSFRLAGMIDEFHELERDREHYGVMSVSITLTPVSGKGAKGMDIFQKSYSVTEKMERENPAALAEALSRAMQKMSQEIGTDINDYINKGLLTLKQM
ncbi:MAG: membrane integrity-associated transporter subunit PqiC [Deltaproteobacteria bacterium]|nr:membrane integrity-associated transporter subunit PqiC [Deltaproteobacteria bacterium]